MAFMMFPNPSAARNQLTSCWSMLGHLRNNSPVLELVTSKLPLHKSLHTMCQRNWNCRHQKSTLVGIRHHSLTTNCCRSVLTKPPFPSTRVTTPTVRWYIRDRGAMPNRNHADKKLLPLTTRRVVRLNKTPGKESTADAKELYDVSAYATAEEYDLEGLSEALAKQGLYSIEKMPPDVVDAMCAEANYRLDDEPREIFFFREGCTIFWNMPVEEREAVLRFIQNHQSDSYDSNQEFEHIEFTYADHPSRLVGDEIHLERLGDRTSDKRQLEKYAFSNALALSVKLAIWEASMSRFVDSIEYVLEDLKAGRKVRISRAKVLRKTGELFNLRHLVNLSSDLLDTPDFYWDREMVEPLYTRTCNHLAITRRTKVINQKLAHCCDLMDLLRDHLNDKNSSRLEWIIIILILVEVLFEVIRMVEKYSAS